MNALSWFLYAADVLEGVATFLFSAGLLSLFGCFLYAMLVHARNYPFEGFIEGEVSKKKIAVFSVTSTLLVLLSQLVPSQEAVYLIAGSEVGQVVVESEVGQEIISDIQEVIKYQLKELKGE